MPSVLSQSNELHTQNDALGYELPSPYAVWHTKTIWIIRVYAFENGDALNRELLMHLSCSHSHWSIFIAIGCARYKWLNIQRVPCRGYKSLLQFISFIWNHHKMISSIRIRNLNDHHRMDSLRKNKIFASRICWNRLCRLRFYRIKTNP